LNQVDILLNSFWKDGQRKQLSDDGLCNYERQQLDEHLANLEAKELGTLLSGRYPRLNIWMTCFDDSDSKLDLGRLAHPRVKPATDVKCWCVVQYRGTASALKSARSSIVKTMMTTEKLETVEETSLWLQSHASTCTIPFVSSCAEAGLVEDDPRKPVVDSCSDSARG
jgi:hypothetical protein